MARRRGERVDEPLAIPPWVATYVPEDWADPADDTTVLAQGWGPALARTVLARGRWSEARHRWGTDHGLMRKELSALARNRPTKGD